MARNRQNNERSAKFSIALYKQVEIKRSADIPRSHRINNRIPAEVNWWNGTFLSCDYSIEGWKEVLSRLENYNNTTTMDYRHEKFTYYITTHFPTFSSTRHRSLEFWKLDQLCLWIPLWARIIHIDKGVRKWIEVESWISGAEIKYRPPNNFRVVISFHTEGPSRNGAW